MYSDSGLVTVSSADEVIVAIKAFLSYAQVRVGGARLSTSASL